jgi:hypothetical protein
MLGVEIAAALCERLRVARDGIERVGLCHQRVTYRRDDLLDDRDVALGERIQ